MQDILLFSVFCFQCFVFSLFFFFHFFSLILVVLASLLTRNRQVLACSRSFYAVLEVSTYKIGKADSDQCRCGSEGILTGIHR